MEFPETIFWSSVLLVGLIFIGFALLFLVGLLQLRSVSRKIADQTQQQLLRTPRRLVSVGGLGMFIITSCIGLYFLIPSQLSQPSALGWQEVACLETSIADSYKLVVSKLRNGEQEAFLDAQDGSERYVYNITRYTVVGNLMIGETHLVDRNFFWFDLKTGGFRRFNEANQDKFAASLQSLGIADEPEMLTMDEHCTRDRCQSCTLPTPRP